MFTRALFFFLFFSLFAYPAPPKRKGAKAPKSPKGSPLALSLLKQKPKLVLLVVFDQFRADYLTRFQTRLLPALRPGDEVGGFGYLMEQGAYFPYGQYDILQSMTGPGHATVLTGSYPYTNGIPLNSWVDREKEENIYCAEDRNQKTIEVVNSKLSAGTSPKNMNATTVGDELKNAGYPSRVVAIALKDRASIFMAGHRADLALWFDSEAFSWVSSRFYFPEGKLPSWVQGLNERLAKRKGEKTVWNLPAESATGFSVENPMTLSAKGTFGNQFPHPIELGTSASLSTPMGAEITEAAAEKAIEAYGLGSGKATDLLAVSFSSHDYLGHSFGPNSREMEEMTISEDRILAQLLNYVRKKVPGGLKNVLVVMTADHGAPPNPDWLAQARVPAGRIDEKDLSSKLENALVAKFGTPDKGKWVAGEYELNFYLNPEARQRSLSDQKSFDQIAKDILGKSEGVAKVVSYSDYIERVLPPGMYERQILKTYYPGRSGDWIAIPKPFYIMGEMTVNHLSGYSYDRTVPILFAGPHIRAGLYSNEIEVIDIAPTLSFMLGTVPPSLSEGKVLSQILVP